MKIIPVICTQCDAPLTIEEGSSMAKCQFCGCSFMISQDDGRVGASKSDQLIRNGRVAFNKLKDYTRAFKYYEEAANENASDFRGYAGMLYSLCAQHEEDILELNVFADMKKYKNNALLFANDEQDAQINGYWHSYVTDLQERRVSLLRNYQAAYNNDKMHCEQDEAALQRIAEDIKTTDIKMAELRDKKNSLEKLHRQKWYLLLPLPIGILIVIVFLMIIMSIPQEIFILALVVLFCLIMLLVVSVIVKIIEKVLIKSNEKAQCQMQERLNKDYDDQALASSCKKNAYDEMIQSANKYNDLKKYEYVE